MFSGSKGGKRMTVAERLARCRVIEKIGKNESYARRLGISDVSIFGAKNKAYIEIKR